MAQDSAQVVTRWGVVLLAMGGPDRAEAGEIERFLFALLSDPLVVGIPLSPLRRFIARRIAKKRTPLVLPRYRTIGGGSPLMKETEDIARELQARLGAEYPVVTAFRYAEPGAKAAVSRLVASGVKRVAVLPLYPQECRSTTESSLRDFRGEAEKAGLTRREIRSFADLPGYIEALADETLVRLKEMPQAHVILTAHGIPERQARSGDPYPAEVARSVQALRDTLPAGIPVTLAYQSRLGPVRWLRPYLDETVVELAKSGVKDIVLVPLSFVSENIETLHELDVELRELALHHGLRRFERVPAPGKTPVFLDALGALLDDAMHTGDEA